MESQVRGSQQQPASGLVEGFTAVVNPSSAGLGPSPPPLSSSLSSPPPSLPPSAADAGQDGALVETETISGVQGVMPLAGMQSQTDAMSESSSLPVQMQMQADISNLTGDDLNDDGGMAMGSQSATRSVCETVRLLKSGWSLPKLVRQFGLLMRRHRSEQLVQLSPVAQECRGLLLELGSWRIAAWPFKKFFHHDEPNAAMLNWNTVDVYEKLDGSLITLYWHEDRWQVASRLLPVAEAFFHEKFWTIWKAKGYKLPSCRDICYMFEMVLVSHLRVVQHVCDDLVCTGARRLDTLQEIRCADVVARTGWSMPKTYSFSSKQQCLAAAEALDPTEQEGFVVVDRYWMRLKIISPMYAMLHRLRAAGEVDRWGDSCVGKGTEGDHDQGAESGVEEDLKDSDGVDNASNDRQPQQRQEAMTVSAIGHAQASLINTLDQRVKQVTWAQHAARSAAMSSGDKEFDHWPGSQAAVSERKEMAKLLRAKRQRAELKAARSRQSQEVFQSLVQHHRKGQAMWDRERQERWGQQ